MKKVIKLTESELIKIIKRTLNEQDDEYYEIPAAEYKQLLSASGYNAVGLLKLRKFGGKPLKVIGDLNLSNTPVTNLGKLWVTGRLDLSNSKIKDIKDVTVNGYVNFYSTPYQDMLDRRKKQQELDEAQERRENGEWDLENPNIDSEGEKANAVFESIVNGAMVDVLDDVEKERLTTLKSQLEDLKERYDNVEEPDQVSELYDEITDLEDEIDELEKKNVDVYGLIPRGSNYDLDVFETTYDEFDGGSYMVGTESEADNALYEYFDQLVDDIGYSSFNTYTLESSIDSDEVADYFEDMFRNDIYESPESYSISRELSDSQEKEIRDLQVEEMILEYYGIRGLQYLTVKNGVYDFMDTNDDEFEFKYEGNQWRLYKGGILTTPGNVYEDGEDEYEDERTDRIVEINDEIDDIKNNPDGDLDDDEVESEVSDRMDEVRNDPMRWINDYEINMDNFIDRRSFVNTLVRENDYSNIGGYNDSYDKIEINGTDYVVIRTS
jgi:hypothetical protein